uniref:Anaphase-promoting complex subunit 10 n=1 Tax=Pongo abelii TaxID=9601 RepID=A0A8I5U7B8_PONAB
MDPIYTIQLELVEPSGWIHVPLTDNHKKPTRTFMIQIAVLANHQNGRDTHMRQIKIYTPVEESSIEVKNQVRMEEVKLLSLKECLSYCCRW